MRLITLWEKRKVHKTCRVLPIIFSLIYIIFQREIDTSSYALMYHRIYYPTKIKGLELKSEYENTTLLPKGQTHKTEELKKKKKTKGSKQRIKD